MGRRWGQLLSSSEENNRGATSAGDPERALRFPRFLLEKNRLLPKTSNRGSQFRDHAVFVLLKQATAHGKYTASHRTCAEPEDKTVVTVFVLAGDMV